MPETYIFLMDSSSLVNVANIIVSAYQRDTCPLHYDHLHHMVVPVSQSSQSTGTDDGLIMAHCHLNNDGRTRGLRTNIML